MKTTNSVTCSRESLNESHVFDCPFLRGLETK
jgi:hypothetical protein